MIFLRAKTWEAFILGSSKSFGRFFCPSPSFNLLSAQQAVHQTGSGRVAGSFFLSAGPPLQRTLSGANTRCKIHTCVSTDEGLFCLSVSPTPLSGGFASQHPPHPRCPRGARKSTCKPAKGTLLLERPGSRLPTPCLPNTLALLLVPFLSGILDKP